jgi:hypothetical protein
MRNYPINFVVKHQTFRLVSFRKARPGAVETGLPGPEGLELACFLIAANAGLAAIRKH